MDKKQMKVFGIIALIVCAVCIFVAIERYQANADAVRAFSQFQHSSPMGDAFGFGEMRPATPASTKYAILFAVISGVAGFVLIIKGGSSSDQPRPPEQPPGTNG
jgi:predicted membrane protein